VDRDVPCDNPLPTGVSGMSQRALIVFAIVANTAVAAISYLVYGWNAVGGHVAARSTARLSVLLFVLAFAQPGLARWISAFPSYAAVFYSFVAAIGVHFVTVAIVLSLDKTHQLRRDPKVELAVIVIGSLNVILAGVTAGLRAIRAMRFLHALFAYALFVIFMLAFVKHYQVPLRGIAVLLAISMVVRIAGGVMRARKVVGVGAA